MYKDQQVQEDCLFNEPFRTQEQRWENLKF